MTTIVIEPNGCDIAHETHIDEEYGEEVMCAGWNPQLPLAAESPVTQINRHVNQPAGLADVDIDMLLKRLYEFQC